MTPDGERMARLQRLLDMLAQVRKQATDLSRMAEELHHEAHESIRLAAETAKDVGSGRLGPLPLPTPTGKKKRSAKARRRKRR
jgi:hypothetical protein